MLSTGLHFASESTGRNPSKCESAAAIRDVRFTSTPVVGGATVTLEISRKPVSIYAHRPGPRDAWSGEVPIICTVAWLDERGYHGTDWMPHDAKVREVGAPGARTRIETLFSLGRKPELAPEQSLMDGINAGRKTIPVARFDRASAASRASSA